MGKPDFDILRKIQKKSWGFADGIVEDCIIVGPPFTVDKETIDVVCCTLEDAIATVQKESDKITFERESYGK